MSGTRKRAFGLIYPNHEPIYLDRFGVEFQVAGMLVQGREDKKILILLPNQVDIHQALVDLDIIAPTVDEWIQILKQADDPEHYETDPSGKIVKAIHRKNTRGISQEVQWQVFRRDGFKCVYCGRERPLSLDHKNPVELGGTDELDNLASACHPCNRKKANMPYEQWLRVLARLKAQGRI